MLCLFCFFCVFFFLPDGVFHLCPLRELPEAAGDERRPAGILEINKKGLQGT